MLILNGNSTGIFILGLGIIVIHALLQPLSPKINYYSFHNISPHNISPHNITSPFIELISEPYTIFSLAHPWRVIFGTLGIIAIILLDEHI